VLWGGGGGGVERGGGGGVRGQGVFVANGDPKGSNGLLMVNLAGRWLGSVTSVTFCCAGV